MPRLTLDMLKTAIGGSIMYHYTLSEYLPQILNEGIIPKKNINSFYKGGANGVFLTTSMSLDKANLPDSIMDLMAEFYESGEEDKPVVRLSVDVSKLDLSKFIYDDDYILNKYGWNKETDRINQIIESINIWSSIAYLGVIPASCITKTDYDYQA